VSSSRTSQATVSSSDLAMTATIELMSGFSLEITGKDADAIADARQYLPDDTRVNITFLGNESLELRVAAARAVAEYGLVPVPHLAARRLASRETLDTFLTALHEVGGSESVFVVGGDPPEPEGPYNDALDLIWSGALSSHGVRAVGIAGYPEGHPQISDALLWQALTDKVAALREIGLAGEITTQFGFDADTVLAWIEQLRARGIELPIRVGVPGPAGAKRLLAYARRFGVGTSAGIARKYGLSLANVLAVAGPDRFITELGTRLDTAEHGTVKFHFYTFGGVEATAKWARDHAGSFCVS
jgi:methylenetetrahydrofolate reductase (NADPH)